MTTSIPRLLQQPADVWCIKADCFGVLPRIPPGAVDLVVTDPPYESLERHRRVGTTTRLKQSDASSNPWFETVPNAKLRDLFQELYQVLRPDTHCYVFCDAETEAVILTGRNPYDADSDAELWHAGPLDSAPFRAWPSLTWVKTRKGRENDDPDELAEEAVRVGMGYHWRRSTERILFLEKGKRKLNAPSLPDVLLGPRAGKSDFPTQKPYGIVRKLIANSTDACPGPRNIVLDPFAGSGIVAEAAVALGRKAILIEKYPTKHLMDRLARLRAQGFIVEWG